MLEKSDPNPVRKVWTCNTTPQYRYSILYYAVVCTTICQWKYCEIISAPSSCQLLYLHHHQTDNSILYLKTYFHRAFLAELRSWAGSGNSLQSRPSFGWSRSHPGNNLEPAQFWLEPETSRTKHFSLYYTINPTTFDIITCFNVQVLSYSLLFF